MYLGADDRQTLGSVFIDFTPVNTHLSREMEGRLFYTVCMNPNWSPIMFGTMCYGLLNLSFRLSGTTCYNCIE